LLSTHKNFVQTNYSLFFLSLLIKEKRKQKNRIIIYTSFCSAVGIGTEVFLLCICSTMKYRHTNTILFPFSFPTLVCFCIHDFIYIRESFKILPRGLKKCYTSHAQAQHRKTFNNSNQRAPGLVKYLDRWSIAFSYEINTTVYTENRNSKRMIT